MIERVNTERDWECRVEERNRCWKVEVGHRFARTLSAW